MTCQGTNKRRRWPDIARGVPEAPPPPACPRITAGERAGAGAARGASYARKRLALGREGRWGVGV